MDAVVEAWLAGDGDCAIDFEVEDALAKRERWELVERFNGRLRALPLAEPKVRLDALWDNFFAYQRPPAS